MATYPNLTHPQTPASAGAYRMRPKFFTSDQDYIRMRKQLIRRSIQQNTCQPGIRVSVSSFVTDRLSKHAKMAGYETE